MSAIRLPLLYAFAGGCLSNVVMFGLWRAAESAGDTAAKQQHRSHNVVELVTPANAPPIVAQPSERVAATTEDRGREQAAEAAPATVATDLDSPGPALAGSAVSDVLTRLEAAYREGVVARAPAQALSPQERTAATAPADNAVAAAPAAPPAPPSVPPQAVAEVSPATPPVSATAAFEPRATAPAALAPQVAPAALAPQVAAMPAVAAPETPPPDVPPPPPTEIHYGDVNQNTFNITNVRQGDVYLIQMQQIAMLQYMQLLGMSPGLAAPARRAGGAGHQRGALSSGITNPDNPWGFHFAPPNLVR